MLIPLIDARGVANNEICWTSSRHVAFARACGRGAKPPRLAEDPAFWLWYLNYGHFYTLLAWHVSPSDSGLAIRTRGGGVRSSISVVFVFTWCASRTWPPSFVALIRGIRIRLKRDDRLRTSRRAADNGGKNDGGVKKYDQFVSDRVFEYSHRFLCNPYGIEITFS